MFQLLKLFAVMKQDQDSSGDSFFNTDSKIIFAHPEALLEDKNVFDLLLKSKKFKENLKSIVVDETHLVSEW